MPKSLTRIALAAATTLALAQPAFATDYCVSPNTTCGGTNVATLQNALATSAATLESDRIFLGAATYTAPVATGYTYQQPNRRVEIVGAGTTDTEITSPPGGSGSVMSVYGGPDTVIRDLTVTIPPNAAISITGLKTDGTVRNVRVHEHVNNSNPMVGVALNGGVLENSDVNLGSWHQNLGVVVDTPGGTIRDSYVSAGTGIQSSAGATIERTHINARQIGLAASRNLTTISSSLIDMPAAGAIAIDAKGNVGLDTTIVADGVSMIGLTGQGTAVTANTLWAPDDNLDIVLRNSIIRGFQKKLSATASGSGTAHIGASYSDYAPGANSTNGQSATIDEANIYNVGNTWANPDDFFSMPAPGLVDAGDPATPQGLDIDRNPLVTDGDHDGVARRDIGAFEAPGPLPGAGDQPPAAASEAAMPVAEPNAEVVALPASDTQAPLVAGFRASHKVFVVTRARTAASSRVARGTRFSYSLSEAARVVVTIRRARTGRVAGRLTRSAKSGRNILKFSGRIGRRSLKPGRYRAAITATDAAGNRSAPKRITFRVAR